jgi:hypothetical protein
MYVWLYMYINVCVYISDKPRGYYLQLDLSCFPPVPGPRRRPLCRPGHNKRYIKTRKHKK